VLRGLHSRDYLTLREPEITVIRAMRLVSTGIVFTAHTAGTVFTLKALS